MRTFMALLAGKFGAFRREWSKARRHMLREKQRNMDYWRNQKGRGGKSSARQAS